MEGDGEQALLVARGDREVDERGAEDLARGQVDDLDAPGVLLTHEEASRVAGGRGREDRAGEALGDELGGEVLGLGREGGRGQRREGEEGVLHGVPGVARRL